MSEFKNITAKASGVYVNISKDGQDFGDARCQTYIPNSDMPHNLELDLAFEIARRFNAAPKLEAMLERCHQWMKDNGDCVIADEARALLRETKVEGE